MKHRYHSHGVIIKGGHDKPRMGKSSNSKLQAAMHEVFTDTPSTVKRAHISAKRKHKMKTRIAYEKARKAGTDV